MRTEDIDMKWHLQMFYSSWMQGRFSEAGWSSGKRSMMLWGGTTFLLFVTSVWFVALRPANSDVMVRLTKQKIGEYGRKMAYGYVESQSSTKEFRKKYFSDSATPKYHGAFLMSLDSGALPIMQKFLRTASPEQRRDWIEHYRQWIENYRCNMSDHEREKLRRALESPEGKKLVENATRFFFSQLSAGEKLDLEPITREITETISQITQQP